MGENNFGSFGLRSQVYYPNYYHCYSIAKAKKDMFQGFVVHVV